MKKYSGKNILITGGLGFIGSNLARSLVNLGANVSLVDNLNSENGGNLFNIQDISDQVTIKICDIRDKSAMLNLIKDKDYLFNLAGQTSHIDSMKNPELDLDINTIAQLNLLELCRKENPQIKIVFASTRQIYGKPDYLPVDEKHHVNPVDVNGINKSAGERYHLLYNNLYGIRSCALRLTNTYGPGMRVRDSRQTFIGIWIRLFIEEKPIKIFGDGLQIRDFNYVDDCVDAFLLAGASNKANGKVFNLGSNEVICLNDLAKIITNFGKGGGIEMVPFPKDRSAIDIGDYFSDFALITKELGWSPKFSLSKGLELTIRYFKKYQSNYWNEDL